MILYEDKEIIVCHKKAGIPVQSARLGQKDMVSILNNHLADQRDLTGRRKKPIQEAEPIRVVHRLDQPVEGVIVFAKTQKAAAGLSRQITEGSMEKIYHAVCCVTEKAKEQFSLRPEEEYCLVDYLVKNPRTNTSAVGRQSDKAAKRAELDFRMLDIRREDNAGEATYLLAEIILKTGRHHQIRVQMANAGLPLYGDRKYNEAWQDFQYNEVKEALALCAVSLTFRHPISGKSMKFEVEPEAEIFRMFK